MRWPGALLRRPVDQAAVDEFGRELEADTVTFIDIREPDVAGRTGAIPGAIKAPREAEAPRETHQCHAHNHGHAGQPASNPPRPRVGDLVGIPAMSLSIFLALRGDAPGLSAPTNSLTQAGIPGESPVPSSQ